MLLALLFLDGLGYHLPRLPSALLCFFLGHSSLCSSYRQGPAPSGKATARSFVGPVRISRSLWGIFPPDGSVTVAWSSQELRVLIEKAYWCMMKPSVVPFLQSHLVLHDPFFSAHSHSSPRLHQVPLCHCYVGVELLSHTGCLYSSFEQIQIVFKAVFAFYTPAGNISKHSFSALAPQ